MEKKIINDAGKTDRNDIQNSHNDDIGKTWRKIKMIKCKQTQWFDARQIVNLHTDTQWDYHNNMIMNVKWAR